MGPLRQSWVEASDYWRKGSPYTPSGRDRGSMGRPGPRDSTVVHGGGLPRLRVLALIVGLGTRRHLFSDDTTLQHHTNVSNLQMRFDAPSPPPPWRVPLSSVPLPLPLRQPFSPPTQPRHSLADRLLLAEPSPQSTDTSNRIGRCNGV